MFPWRPILFIAVDDSTYMAMIFPCGDVSEPLLKREPVIVEHTQKYHSYLPKLTQLDDEQVPEAPTSTAGTGRMRITATAIPSPAAAATWPQGSWRVTAISVRRR